MDAASTTGTSRLTDWDRFEIERARQIAPALKHGPGDRERLAAQLLADLADLAERLAGDAG